MMTPRDLSEIKRRLNADKRNPTVIRGCYVSGEGETLAEFNRPVAAMSQDDLEKFLSLFRRSLSGTAGQNLLPVVFSAAQALESAEHDRLMALKDSGLKDEEAVHELYARIVSAMQSKPHTQEGPRDSYLILLLHDRLDVSFRNKNDEADPDQGGSVFQYVLCCVCPVKPTKPILGYFPAEQDFHAMAADWAVSFPETGFMFPSWEEHGSNLWEVLFYTKDASDAQETFIESLFATEPAMPAAEQKETFQSVLRDSLQEECSLEVVQTVHDTVRGLIEEQKQDKNAAPLCLSTNEIENILDVCGVSEEKKQEFSRQYDDAFGTGSALPAVNMVSPKEFKVTTPSVSIRVDSAHSDLVQARMIDGRYYIMVLADGDVEVNGMQVRM